MNKITFEFACLDDCLDKMVPSDLREVVAERDRLRERNEALEELVVGLEEVRSKEYEFKQARIEALEKDFAYHVELCTSQQARIGALTAEVEEQARLLGASGSREAELLARVEALREANRQLHGELATLLTRIEALENAAKSVAKAKGKGFAQVHKDDVPWFMHLMNRIDALAALLHEPSK